MTVVYKYKLRTLSLLGLPCQTIAHTTPVNKQTLFAHSWIPKFADHYSIVAGIFYISFTMAILVYIHFIVRQTGCKDIPL